MKRKEFIKKSAILSVLPVLGGKNSFISGSPLVRDSKKNIPPRLKQNDVIGLIAPGSYITENQLHEAITNIEKLGFKTHYTENILKKSGYLAGNDHDRSYDVNYMFANKRVKGIVAIRGGYGCARILPMIDYNLIKRNPKILIGYSDITALLYGIYSQTGLVCFHGPVATSTFNDYSVNHLENILFHPRNNYTMRNLPEDEGQIKIISEGAAEGELVGGNLSIVVSLIGTKYDVVLKNKILFLEDVGEEPYRIDRMLTQLLQSKDLSEAAGIALGVFKNCEKKIKDPEFHNSFSLLEVFEDRLSKLNIPVIYGLSFGHIENKFTLPFGVKARLDTNDPSLTLLEKAVE